MFSNSNPLDRFTSSLDIVLSLPENLSELTVARLRDIASHLRLPSTIRAKSHLIAAVTAAKASLDYYIANRFQQRSLASSDVEQAPAPEVESLPSPSSVVDIPTTLADTLQLRLVDPLSVATRHTLASMGIDVTEHKTDGTQIFVYLNKLPLELALIKIDHLLGVLSALQVNCVPTIDKTYDKAMTEKAFKSGKLFPGFVWNSNKRQWEHTDSNGVMTRIYDKTDEVLRRGEDDFKWAKGKFDNDDLGVSYALHTIRVEARHHSIESFNSTPLHCPQVLLDYETTQTYLSAASEAVSLISIAIKSKTKKKLGDLLPKFFDALTAHFNLFKGTDKRFSELKAQLKKLHPDLAAEISKIRRNK